MKLTGHDALEASHVVHILPDGDDDTDNMPSEIRRKSIETVLKEHETSLVMMLWRPRTWCTFCPMGTMTQIICRLKSGERV